MTLRLTNSEVSTWRRCPRKWYWEAYRGLRRRSEPLAGSPLTLGSRVHVALSEHYSGGDALALLDQMLEEDVAAEPEGAPDTRKESDLARAMVEGYIEWVEETGVDEGIEVVAAETRVEVPLGGVDGVNLLSKLDARVERHGHGTPARLSLEFKTVPNLTSPLPTLAIDSQLLTEHLAEFLALREQGRDEERAQGVLYRMLRKVKRTASAKPPFYGEEEVPHSLDELRNHWRHLVSYATQILDARARLDAGESHHAVTPPSPQQSCSWYCPLLAACKLANADADVEGYLESRFEVRDPLERYLGTTMVSEP